MNTEIGFNPFIVANKFTTPIHHQNS